MGVQFGSALDLPQMGTPAATPAAGRQLLYVKSDGKVYSKNSSGAEVLIAPGSAAIPDPLAVNALQVKTIDYNPAGTGDIAYNVSVNMAGNYIYGVHTPTNTDHAMTKGYGDTTYATKALFDWYDGTATTSIPNGGSITSPVGGWARHTGVTNPNLLSFASQQFTVLAGQAGLYEINASITFSAPAAATATRRLISLLVNGSEVRRTDIGSPALAVPVTLGLSHAQVLAVGDVIGIGAFQNSGAAVNLQGTPQGHELQFIKLG